MSAFYNYSEPFSAECRAFGRLQEAKCENLAVQCFGYTLLDEEHESALMNRFSDLHLDFNGNGDDPGAEDMRSRFLGQDGRPPPLRGVIKAFGQSDEDLRTRSMQRILRDVIQLQQLGIIHIDIAHRQLINGKFADFSQAITVPHFVTSTELNPRLTPKWISALEFETFQFSINDYWRFDSMIRDWNKEHEKPKDQISIYAFPGGRGCQIKYNLRSTARRRLLYSLVDPRLYDWRSSAGASTGEIEAAAGAVGGRVLGQKLKGKAIKSPRRATSRTYQRLDPNPPRWYYHCDGKVASRLKSMTSFSTSLKWEFKEGLIFPRRKT
jgi:Kinetochore Sim4 complex subunit FTA2